MAIINSDNKVNAEAVRDIYKNILKILSKGVTPENIRVPLVWEEVKKFKAENLVIYAEGMTEYIEFKFKSKVHVNSVPMYVSYIQNMTNEAHRYHLDSNPAVVRIKNRVESILDDALESKGLCQEHGVFFLYDVNVDYVDKSIMFDDWLEIKLTVYVNQLG